MKTIKVYDYSSSRPLKHGSLFTIKDNGYLRVSNSRNYSPDNYSLEIINGEEVALITDKTLGPYRIDENNSLSYLNKDEYIAVNQFCEEINLPYIASYDGCLYKSGNGGGRGSSSSYIFVKEVPVNDNGELVIFDQELERTRRGGVYEIDFYLEKRTPIYLENSYNISKYNQIQITFIKNTYKFSLTPSELEEINKLKEKYDNYYNENNNKVIDLGFTVEHIKYRSCRKDNFDTYYRFTLEDQILEPSIELGGCLCCGKDKYTIGAGLDQNRLKLYNKLYEELSKTINTIHNDPRTLHGYL